MLKSIMMSTSFPGWEHLLPHRLEAVVWERGLREPGYSTLRADREHLARRREQGHPTRRAGPGYRGAPEEVFLLMR